MLLLNAGDNFQGSLFYTTYKGKAEAEFLNLMKFDAMTLGNHEFDDGEDALVPFLDMIKFPVLTRQREAQCAVQARRPHQAVARARGRRPEDRHRRRASPTTRRDLASPGPNITIEDDVKAITAEVEKLKAQGVNKIIALTHIGYARERDVIAKIPGVDVVVGGHSHSLLSNTDPKAEGPYPTMVDNPDGYKVPVVQAASYSKYLGEFKVVFDDNGVVKEANGDPIFLDKSITPDAAVLARIKELGAPIEELKNKEVSETTEADRRQPRQLPRQECEMGNLVSDAILDRVKDQGVEIVVPERRRLARLDRPGRGHHGRSADRAAVPEHAGDLPDYRQGRRRRARGRRQPDRGRRRPLPAGRRPEIFLRQVGRAECRPHQVGRGDGRRRLDADRPDKDLYWSPPTTTSARAATATRSSPTTAQNAYDYGPGLEQVVADYLQAHRPYTPKLDGRITEIAARRDGAGRPAAAPAGNSRDRSRDGTGRSRPIRRTRQPAVDRRRRQLFWKPRRDLLQATRPSGGMIADANPGKPASAR